MSGAEASPVDEDARRDATGAPVPTPPSPAGPGPNPNYKAPLPLPPIERIIPWRYRINTAFLGITVALAVAGIAMFAIAETRMQEQFFETQAAGADLFSDTIERATSKAMLEDRRSDAYETMREIGRQEGVESVRFVAKDGRVVFSTIDGEVGKVLDKNAHACAPCHSNGTVRSHAPLLERTRVFQQDGHRVLGLITPIRNERRCFTSECHEHKPSDDVLGVLDVNLSLAPADARVGSFRRGSVLLTAVSVLLLAGFFFAFTRRHIVRPVQALVDATRRVAVDQLDTELRVRSKGELGLLAASFNDMVRSLRRMEGELRDFMLDLERQVEERTVDLKKAQAALVQSEKLSSLGRLSASIAHEINNPLAGILTFAKLCIRTLESRTPDEATRKDLVKHLALVQRETERCSAIVRNLLDFARDRPLALREVGINAVIEEGLQLVGHQIAIQGLTLEKHLTPVGPVMADFGQLRQAIVNVVLNGIQAMKKGGTLRITTRPAPEGGVQILISDTGPGIPREHLAHLFEPFFTTKEKGTGLGLSVVYGIVQRHHGRIEVESEPGQTTFTITLPATVPEGQDTEQKS